MRNYDSTSKKPYPRVSEVHITYPTEGNPLLTYTERDAIVDADNNVHFLDTGIRQCTVALDLSKRKEPIQIIHPATGNAIPGLTTSLEQIILSITAVIRADQFARDTPAHDVSET